MKGEKFIKLLLTAISILLTVMIAMLGTWATNVNSKLDTLILDVGKVNERVSVNSERIVGYKDFKESTTKKLDEGYQYDQMLFQNFNDLNIRVTKIESKIEATGKGK